jgi:hypothetical protein
MSDKTRRELELLADALDEAEPTPEEIAGTVARLPVTPAKWAVDIRGRIAAADEADRQARFEQSRRGYRNEVRRLDARKPEPVRPIHEAQLIIKDLMARAPAGVSVNFLKYENATEEELAEMIRALRHLLGEDET